MSGQPPSLRAAHGRRELKMRSSDGLARDAMRACQRVQLLGNVKLKVELVSTIRLEDPGRGESIRGNKILELHEDMARLGDSTSGICVSTLY